MELRAECFVVKPFAVHNLVGLVKHSQAALTGKHVGFHRKADLFALEPAGIHGHPQIRLLGCHPHVEQVLELSINVHVHGHDIGRVPESGYVNVIFLDQHGSLQQCRWARFSDRVALVDVIDQDMPHAAGVLVEDFDHRLFAHRVADVPVAPEQDFVVTFVTQPVFAMWGRRRSHRFSVQQKIHARLPRESTSADQKVDVLALDSQRW